MGLDAAAGNIGIEVAAWGCGLVSSNFAAPSGVDSEGIDFAAKKFVGHFEAVGWSVELHPAP